MVTYMSVCRMPYVLRLRDAVLQAAEPSAHHDAKTEPGPACTEATAAGCPHALASPAARIAVETRTRPAALSATLTAEGLPLQVPPRPLLYPVRSASFIAIIRSKNNNPVVTCSFFG